MSLSHPHKYSHVFSFKRSLFYIVHDRTYRINVALLAPHALCPSHSPPERAQEPAGSQRDEDEEAADGDQDEALLVPQVKVAEDGSLIIDESRLVPPL